MEPEIKELKKYYNNGQLQEHSSYRNWKLEVYKQLYEKVLLLESYDDSVSLDGEYKKWHDNGQLWIHSFYKNGVFDGEYKRWWSNGHLAIQCFYRSGELDGEYKRWYENGQLYEHSFYYHGNEIYKLNDAIVGAIVKFQRSFRIRRALNKYFTSREFAEWWYSPTVRGGLLAKQEILSTISEM